MTRGEDVVIVGGGIAGVTLAYILSLEMPGVTLISRPYTSMSSSELSAGIVTPLVKYPWMARRSLEFYMENFEGSTRPYDLTWIAKGSCISRHAGFIERHGFPVDYRAPKWVRLGDDEDYITTRTVVVDFGSLLYEFSKKAGGRVKRVSGAAIVEAYSGGFKIIAGGTSLKPRIAVIATGPWTRDLASKLDPSLAEKLVIYECQASSVRVEGVEGGSILIDDSLGYYASPEGRGAFIVGDGPNRILDDPLQARPDYEEALDVAYRFAQRVGGPERVYIRSLWASPCSSTRESTPLVERLDYGGQSIIIYAGLDGAGITLAPAVSEMIAGHILRGDPLGPPWSGDSGPEDKWPPEPFLGC